MEATGVINAGGRSSRMQMNKAFVKINGQTILDRLLGQFIPLFDDVIIISNDPDLFEHKGIHVYRDVYERKGPVAGIHTALHYARFDKVFVLGCDMPFIPSDLIQFMMDKLDGYDSVVPQIHSHLQPMSAAYHRKSLHVFERSLELDHLKLVRVFEELNAYILTEEDIKSFGDPEEIFFNVNDLDALRTANLLAGRYR